MALGVTAAAMLLAVAPAAAVDAPPVPAVPDDGVSAQPPDTTTTEPPTLAVPSPTTTDPASPPVSSPPPAPREPASATAPSAAPDPVVGELEPTPDAHPFSVELSASAADVSGALGVAESAAALVRIHVAAIEGAYASTSASLGAASAALDGDELEATAAAQRASGASEQADAARRAAIAAATDSLLSSRTTPHPFTELALHGDVGPDDLWAYGFRRALAEPVGARVEQSRHAAATARRRAHAAAVARDVARGHVESVTADLDERRRDLDQARADLAAADTRVADARATALGAFGAGASTPDAQRVSVLDIPVRTLDAYLLAERRLAVAAPACQMRWWVVAGIGAVESGHGTFGGAYPAADGVVRPPIIGPRLDGGAFARIGDTDGGRLDGDTGHDRAVGPMQFIPSTWASSGGDGNGDGVADPHNVYDAAYAAANYLCRGARGAAVDTAVGFAAAAWSYNRSRPYGATTWQRAVAYSAVAPRVVGGLSSAP